MARRTVEIANQEAKLRRFEIPCFVVPCRVDTRTGLGRAALEVLAELGVPVAQTVIRHRIAWPEAMSAGIPIFDLPASRAADAIREAAAACDEIASRLHEAT